MEESILDVLQEWINNLDASNLTTQSIRIYVSNVNIYLKYHKIRIELKDLDWPEQLHEEPYVISLKEIHQILEAASWKKKGYHLSLLSTGARPIEILGLRKKDIQWNDTCYTAIIPARHADVPIWRTSGYYRKGMERNFPKQLYSHRNKSETVFFVAKRMMSEDVMSRKETTQDNEMLLRLIAYNAYRITKLEFVVLAWFLQGPNSNIFSVKSMSLNPFIASVANSFNLILLC